MPRPFSAFLVVFQLPAIMSADLIARALEVDALAHTPGYESIDEETRDMIETMCQPRIVCNEETAMSQHSEGRVAEEGPSERQNVKGQGKEPVAKVTPPKKKGKVCSDIDEGIKTEKTKDKLKVTQAKNGRLHCIFEERKIDSLSRIHLKHVNQLPGYDENKYRYMRMPRANASKSKV